MSGGKSITAIVPYSAIASRGQLELHYAQPLDPLCLPFFGWSCPEFGVYNAMPCDA